MATNGTILEQIQALVEAERARKQSASQDLGFAQRLRDERLQSIQKFQQQQAPTFTQDTAIPDNPIERFDRGEAFLQAGRGILDPVEARISAAQKQQDDASAGELKALELLLSGQEAQQTGGMDDILKQRKALVEAGISTKQLDEELEASGFEFDVNTKLDSLTSTEGKPIKEYTSALLRMKGLLSEVERLSPDASSSDAASQVTAVTGPLIKRVGFITGNESKQLREDLDNFQQEVRNKLYGATFTANESRVAVLPGSGKQESRNARILKSFIKQKEIELYTALKNSGFTTKQIQQYKELHGLEAPVPGAEKSDEADLDSVLIKAGVMEGQ
jgi:hypothetical protein